MRYIRNILLLALTIFSIGCGSGGGSNLGYIPGDRPEDPVDPQNVNSVQGTFAQGLAIPGTIILIDRNGEERSTTSDNNGFFTISIESLEAPFILQGTASNSSVILYSVVDNATVTVANITPLTSYMVNQMAVDAGLGGGVSQLFTNFSILYSSVEDNFQDVLEELNALLGESMENDGLGDFNHFTSIFEADQTEYDAYLDSLDIEISEADLVIRVEGEILNTLPYEVSESTITLTGQIYNAIDSTPIEGVSLNFINAHGDANTTTDASGEYSVTLDNFRIYDLEISAAGFTTLNYDDISTFATGAISIGLVPLIDTSIDGIGTVKGKVVNARNLDDLAGVNVNFREGANDLYGDIVGSVVTDSLGEYSIELPTGIYTAEFTLDGYTSRDSIVIAYDESTESVVDDVPLVAATVVSENNDGAVATIVLTWAENPRDLDTFLTGPSTVLDTSNSLNGEDFKLAYYQKIFTTDEGYSSFLIDFNRSNPCATENVIASIDLDDTSSYGPETTTICQVEDGLYGYYVHHFSGLSTITDSPAQVTVTTASGQRRDFIAPQGATGANTDLWHVFNMDNYGNIYPVNSFVTDSSTILNGAPSVYNNTQGNFSSKTDLLIDLPAK